MSFTYPIIMLWLIGDFMIYARATNKVSLHHYTYFFHCYQLVASLLLLAFVVVSTCRPLPSSGFLTTC